MPSNGPNVAATKRVLNAREASDISADEGMLPLVAASTHPSVVNRWKIRNKVIPTLHDGGRQMFNGRGSVVRDVIWVDAWVVALLSTTSSRDILTNAWTTVGENKPRILELKIEYDELLEDPSKRLVLLVAYRLSLNSSADSDLHIRGTDRAMQLLHAGD